MSLVVVTLAWDREDLSAPAARWHGGVSTQGPCCPTGFLHQLC